jgi:G:T-mismatch repair DNA endonuclease (very short patch repair protein)
MKQLYQECIDRKTIFEENGYTVVYMWECEWKKETTKLRSNTHFSISDTSGDNLPKAA